MSGSQSILTKMKSAFKVDRFMVPSKITFLLLGGLLGSHLPFLNVFFVSVGLSPSQAGFITGIRFLPSTLFYLVWGALVDFTGKRKVILVLMCLGAAIPISSMPYVSHFIYVTSNETCHTKVNTSTAILYEDHDNCATRLHTLFSVLLAIMTFASIFVGPLPGYIDTIIMQVVKSCKTPRNFGWQRTFSSLGLGAANFAAGIAADHFSHPGMSSYSAVFIMYFICTILIIPVGCYVIDQTSWESEPNPIETKEKTILKDGKQEVPIEEDDKMKQLFRMLKTADVMFFMCTALIAGLTYMVYLNFVFLLLQHEVSATKIQMGLVLAVSSCSEAVALAAAARIIKTLGRSCSVILGLFSYFVRFVIMSYSRSFWVILSLQSIHGIGFCVSFVAMIEHIQAITPKDINATMMAILQGVHFGLSALVANVVGGRIYEHFGGRVLFQSVGMLCIVWAMLMVLYHGSSRFEYMFCRDQTTTGRDLSSSDCSRTQCIELGLDNQGKDVMTTVKVVIEEKQ